MATCPGRNASGQDRPEPIELRSGEAFTLTTEEIIGSRQRVSMSFDRLPRVVKPGDRLFLNDGLVQLVVERIAGNDVAAGWPWGASCVPARGSTCRVLTSALAPSPTMTAIASNSRSNTVWMR